MKTVLVLGGSGYLGQFLVQSLTKSCRVSPVSSLQQLACVFPKHVLSLLEFLVSTQVGFTHHSTSPPDFGGSEQAFWVQPPSTLLDLTQLPDHSCPRFMLLHGRSQIWLSTARTDASAAVMRTQKPCSAYARRFACAA